MLAWGTSSVVTGGFVGKDITRTALSLITHKEEEGADFPLHQQAQPAPPCLQIQSHILMEAGNRKSLRAGKTSQDAKHVISSDLCGHQETPAQSQRPGSATQRCTGRAAVALISLTDEGTMCDVSTSGLAQRLLGCVLGELTPTRSMARLPTRPL